MAKNNNQEQELMSYLNENPQEYARLARFRKDSDQEFSNHMIALPGAAKRHPTNAISTILVLVGGSVVATVGLIFISTSFNFDAGARAVRDKNAIPPNILEVWYGGRK